MKRIHDAPAPSDGTRVLVDRIWPRGVRAEDAALNDWAKEIAPSHALRRWYGHVPARFPEFRDRYRLELRDHFPELQRLEGAARRGTLTLVFAARDPAFSNAAVLKEFLEERLC